MTKEELFYEINRFAQQVVLHILRDYQDSLGLANEARLRDLLGTNFVVFDELPTEIHDSLVHIFLYENDLKGLNYEEMHVYIKRNILVRELFRYIIHSKLESDKNTLGILFAKDLTEGLVLKYATDFSMRHDLGKPLITSSENLFLAEELLKGIPENISKDALVFQYSYPFILDYYYVGTGKNFLDFYHKYKNSSEKLDMQTIPTVFNLERKLETNNSQGFLEGTAILLACAVLGVFLAYLLVR